MKRKQAREVVSFIEGVCMRTPGIWWTTEYQHQLGAPTKEPLKMIKMNISIKVEDD